MITGGRKCLTCQFHRLQRNGTYQQKKIRYKEDPKGNLSTEKKCQPTTCEIKGRMEWTEERSEKFKVEQ